jgi:hypothetical protein
MPDAWMPGADRSHEAPSDGGSILGGKPKILWHDTETSSLPSYSSGSFPHFTVDPESGHIWQHIPANRAARALKNPDGGCQTNRWNVIQVEIIGWVNKIPYHAALGQVAAWALQQWQVPARCDVDLLPYDDSYGNTTVRLSCNEWDGYSGHLFHMSAPENDHGDPGSPFPVDQILAAAGGGEEDMLAAWEEDDLRAVIQSELEEYRGRRPKNLTSDPNNKPLTEAEATGAWGGGVPKIAADVKAQGSQIAAMQAQLDRIETLLGGEPTGGEGVRGAPA